MQIDLKQLAATASEAAGQNLPPVHLWNPPFCGDIDIRIARNGTWFHEGTAIQREALVRLFSTILKKEGAEYFLVTPVEKVRIRVEDVPFLAVGMTVTGTADSPTLLFQTLTGDSVALDAQHPLRVETDPVSGEPRPYIHVRGGMDARIHRPVFYDLVALGRESVIDGEPHLVLDSAGQTFSLGRL